VEWTKREIPKPIGTILVNGSRELAAVPLVTENRCGFRYPFWQAAKAGIDPDRL
jgi:hypothetical protein